MLHETAMMFGELFANIGIAKAKRKVSTNAGINEYEDGVAEGLQIAMDEIMDYVKANK